MNAAIAGTTIRVKLVILTGLLSGLTLAAFQPPTPTPPPPPGRKMGFDLPGQKQSPTFSFSPGKSTRASMLSAIMASQKPDENAIWMPRGSSKAPKQEQPSAAPAARKSADREPLAASVENIREVRVYRAGKLPDNLPSWFKEYDTNGDGQVALHEWKEKGGTLKAFRELDLNGDGFITVDELILGGHVVVVKNAPAPAPAPAPEPEPEPQLETIPDPGNMVRFHGQHNKEFFIEVTGKNAGGVWGTDTYTEDSNLATAAVHAGLVGIAQKGVIKVTVLPDQGQYTGSTRNGVTTNNYGPFSGSYRIEAAR